MKTGMSKPVPKTDSRGMWHRDGSIDFGQIKFPNSFLLNGFNKTF